MPPPIFFITRAKNKSNCIEKIFEQDYKLCKEEFSKEYIKEMEIDPDWKVVTCTGKEFYEKYLQQ